MPTFTDKVQIKPFSQRFQPLIALVFLVATGGLLSLSTILAKIAPHANLHATAFLAWSVTAAAIILLAEASVRGGIRIINRHTFEYFVIAAFLSLVGPNLIFFAAVPEIGASFVALALAMPPLLTYAGALAMRMERFDELRASGVLVALIGTFSLAWVKVSDTIASPVWVVAVLAAPVLLAAGNIYRSLRWPLNARPEDLAPGMLLAAAMMVLLVASAIPGGTIMVPLAIKPLGLIFLQAVCFAMQYRLFFILQKVGGPVLLSLLGTVAAVVTVPVAILIFREPLPAGFFLSASLIVVGIAMLVVRQAKVRQAIPLTQQLDSLD